MLEVQTAGAFAYAVLADGRNPPFTLGILCTAATADRWRPDHVQKITLPGADGLSSLFSDEPDRYVVVGNNDQAIGARLTRSRWVPWAYSCQATGAGANAPAVTAIGTMYAACPIVSGPSGLPATAPVGSANGQVWLYTSTDHGTSFRAISPIPAPTGSPPGPISATSGSILLGINHELQASFESGRTWAPVWNQQPTAIHFQTSTTGEALVPSTKLPAGAYVMSGQLITTHDGGHTWHPENMP